MPGQSFQAVRNAAHSAAGFRSWNLEFRSDRDHAFLVNKGAGSRKQLCSGTFCGIPQKGGRMGRKRLGGAGGREKKGKRGARSAPLGSVRVRARRPRPVRLDINAVIRPHLIPPLPRKMQLIRPILNCVAVLGSVSAPLLIPTSPPASLHPAHAAGRRNPHTGRPAPGCVRVPPA